MATKTRLAKAEEKKAVADERRKLEKAERLAERKRLYPWRYCVGFHLREVKGTPPKGLDKSCYGPQTTAKAVEVWRDGKLLDRCENARAAKDYVEYVEKHGYKPKAENKCKADGSSLTTKTGSERRQIPTGYSLSNELM